MSKKKLTAKDIYEASIQLEVGELISSTCVTCGHKMEDLDLRTGMYICTRCAALGLDDG